MFTLDRHCKASSELTEISAKCLGSVYSSLRGFCGCEVIGKRQGNYHHLMLKFSYCGHIKSHKERCG